MQIILSFAVVIVLTVSLALVWRFSNLNKRGQSQNTLAHLIAPLIYAPLVYQAIARRGVLDRTGEIQLLNF